MGKVFSASLIAAVLALVPLQVWAADAPGAASPAVATPSAKQPPASESAEAHPNGQQESTGTVIQSYYGPEIQCAGCSPVSRQVKQWGATILKFFQENGDLPDSVVRLSGPEIDTLLRGKSWSSDVVSGFGEEEYQRLLAFDANGRGRWLNFMRGPKGYSTLCQFTVEENMLCLACTPSPAQCSEVYRDKTDAKGQYLALDREKERLELYDWILDSRWEDGRFLAPH